MNKPYIFSIYTILINTTKQAKSKRLFMV